MSSVNKVIIVGRLGQDPEVRQFQNGNSVTNISVATSERWMDRATGEQKEKTEWHKIVLQNRGNYRLGDIAVQYLRKGLWCILKAVLVLANIPTSRALNAMLPRFVPIT